MFELFLCLSAPLGAGAPPGDEAEVQAAVAAARAGDAAAARQLYQWFCGQVYRVLRPLVPSDADAEDIMQDTFIRALSQLDRYRCRPGARFVSWLITIARNAAFNRRRKEGRLEPLTPEAAPTATTGGLAELDRRQALLVVLSEIPERDRWIIAMRYGAGLTANEAAQECGITAANVRQVTTRQRAYLRSRLQALGIDEDDL